MAIKLEGGGGKALVARPLVDELFCGFPYLRRGVFTDWTHDNIQLGLYGTFVGAEGTKGIGHADALVAGHHGLPRGQGNQANQNQSLMLK